MYKGWRWSYAGIECVQQNKRPVGVRPFLGKPDEPQPPKLKVLAVDSVYECDIDYVPTDIPDPVPNVGYIIGVDSIYSCEIYSRPIPTMLKVDKVYSCSIYSRPMNQFPRVDNEYECDFGPKVEGEIIISRDGNYPVLAENYGVTKLNG